jgi:hypothetical protein
MLADTSLLRPGSRNANGIPFEEGTSKLACVGHCLTVHALHPV